MELEYFYIDDTTIRYALLCIAVCFVVKIAFSNCSNKK